MPLTFFDPLHASRKARSCHFATPCHMYTCGLHQMMTTTLLLPPITASNALQWRKSHLVRCALCGAESNKLILKHAPYTQKAIETSLNYCFDFVRNIYHILPHVFLHADNSYESPYVSLRLLTSLCCILLLLLGFCPQV